jgi:hypothetical protein
MFHGWDSFYLLIGPAAAALIGLLFVVTTLTVGIERGRARRGAAVYMTPTLFHFAVVVTASATALVPGIGAGPAGAVLGGCALAGLVYALSVTVRIAGGSAVPDQAPHWTDVWYYGVAPAAIYVVLGAGALTAWAGSPRAPAIAGAALTALLLIGIRNAWDLVTWLAPKGKG